LVAKLCRVASSADKLARQCALSSSNAAYDDVRCADGFSHSHACHFTTRRDALASYM
jgi:hypothetical protein